MELYNCDPEVYSRTMYNVQISYVKVWNVLKIGIIPSVRGDE